MGQSFRVAIGAALSIAAFAGNAYALNDPPSQAGRLAYTEGTVSFHDDQQAGWTPAVINTPLTSGDSIWTEPNARSEVSVAGTRVRMDGSTQLNLLAIEDNQTRLQVGQGRVDIKTFALNPNTPYQIVTPRGTVNLRQQGDYYVEAGSTQDATRLGVRAGAAQMQSLNGQTVTVNPGQVAEVFGDTGALKLRTLNTAPPVQPASWAARDRQINYDPPSQYVSAGITGYEDLNSYGSWSNDNQYGNVWTPRSVPSGWQPYKQGHWSYVKPWGWTWVDDQPWGYAPSHYGRWANSNNRWVWVPPQREAQPVYAPALVNFIGGIQLVQALLGGNTSLGTQASAPVGWFPLAPREAYVPSYSTDRAYYTRLNSSNEVQAQALEDRWQRAQRREAYIAGQNSALANQRFATVIPSSVFVGSQPVARAALQVSAAQIAAAPVAPVSAPPAPTASIAAAPAATPAAADPKAATPVPAADPKAEADAKAKAEAQAKVGANANLPVAKTAVADMPTLAQPTTTAKPAAPGPKLATAPATPAATTSTTTSTTGTATTNATATPQAKVTAPPLVPRAGAAPPVLKDDKTPAAPPAAAPQAKAPAANDTKTPSVPNAVPPAPAKPDTTAKPAEPPKAATPATPPQAKPDPVKPADAPKTEAPKPDAPKAAAPPQAQPAPAAPRPAEIRTPPADTKVPEKGAAVTPQIPAPVATPAVQPPKPPVQVEPKIAVPQPPAPVVVPSAAKPAAVDKDDEPKKDDDKKDDKK
ncbi:MAG: hypothetical protein Q8N31_25720 [Reyranella sp.]|nr:hypothetical protein [Reyranella sp.]MDP3163426.1 hypothetical protein [Reyranella sp.]